MATVVNQKKEPSRSYQIPVETLWFFVDSYNITAVIFGIEPSEYPERSTVKAKA